MLTVCIDYSLRPRLSSRLTRADEPCRKPYPYGGLDSNQVYRYKPGFSLPESPPSLSFGFNLANAFLPLSINEEPVFGTMLSPIIFGADSLDGSAITLFKWWLPLSQHHCLVNPPPFPLSMSWGP